MHTFLCEFYTDVCYSASARWLSTACMALPCQGLSSTRLAIYLICLSHRQSGYVLDTCSVNRCKLAVDICEAAAKHSVITMQRTRLDYNTSFDMLRRKQRTH